MSSDGRTDGTTTVRAGEEARGFRGDGESLVYVVDDDEGMRESLRFLLQSVRLPVRAFDRADAFLSEFDPNPNSCLVADLRMPGMSGLELHEHLRASGHKIPVVIITGHGDVPTAVRAMKHGAADFLEKPFHDQVFIDCVQRLLERDREARRRRARFLEVGRRLDSLSPRERQVLEKVLEGRINKQIASDLGVGIKAIEAHRARIMDKMGVDSVQELVREVTLHRESIARGTF